ncbi:gem-associated protein 5-like [Trichoplusia ni]|uniref:Gem-associated protein 5-like n=1 Tax=Trichoplusia ni TaxID=7111 RepID=A0A7E5WYK4_TRINI|nr:gem-associated protein 5-like [Trichoplusia ni]
MEETILLPSPSWFLVSNIAVSTDGWVIYGGPSKSLCVLEPIKSDDGIIEGNDKYRAHVVTRAHLEKIVSVDLSPEWLEKRNFISGSSDGLVKQWIVEKLKNKYRIKATHSHEVHQKNKEEIAGIGYSNETTAITVGTYGNIVKWNFTANLAKTYPNMMKNFKPTCMACSQHLPLHVAIGTKQGVIFVMDLTNNGKLIYKVRGQDDEVMNVSWCPKFEVSINKTLKESENRSFLTKRLEAIRNEGEKESVLEQSGIGKNLPEDSFDESIVEEDDTFDIYKDHEPDEFGHKKYVPEDVIVKVKEEKPKNDDFLAECLKLREEILKRKNQPEPSIESLVQALDETHVEGEAAVETEVPEAEKAKEVEPSTSKKSSNQNTKDLVESSPHMHRHLLATVGKYGGVRIWSKSGKLVATCAIPNNAKTIKNKGSNWPTLLWYRPNSLLVVDGKSQLLEMNPLQIDCKNKLEFRVVHSLHKRGMYCIASDAPRVFSSDTPTNGAWSVWSFSQDRNIIRYCMKTKKVVGIHATCGGFLYTVLPCPYDAEKIAVSVGDGAVRVCSLPWLGARLQAGPVSSHWQHVQGKVLALAWHPTRENLLAFATAESRVGLIDTSKPDKPARPLQTALNDGVYSLCWGEGMNLYANGGGKLVMYRADKPDEAPTAVPVSLEGECWQVFALSGGPRGLLCGSFVGGVALLTPLPPHTLVAAAFVFSKMIHSMEWHPQQTSSSSDESPYKDLIAACSLERDGAIAILEFGTKPDGTKQLTKWKTLLGHKGPVFQVAWNPHRDELLLSTSQDSSVRVWDISAGACVSIFGGHGQASLGAAWLAQPGAPALALSGGADACLRLWDARRHAADSYDDTKHEVHLKKKEKKAPVKKEAIKNEAEPASESGDMVAMSYETGNERVVSKVPKKFMLPLMFKQMNDPNQLPAPRKMLQLYLEKTEKAIKKEDGSKNLLVDENSNTNTVDEKGDRIKLEGEVDSDVLENKDLTVECTEENENSSRKDEIDLDFLKVFGSIKEVNEFLDMEMKYHLATGSYEAWIMLSIFRGHIDNMIQFASQKDMLDPFLLSIAPCVSFKYWKDATQLYLAQIDRVVAMKEEEKLYEVRQYGGPVYRKVAVLLSIHDVKGAVAALVEAKFFKEGYILSRLRYMDSVAESILKEWAVDLAMSGRLTVAAICYIALNDLSQAAQVLSRSKYQEGLSLAADIAKAAGRNSFADHVESRKYLKAKLNADKTEEILKALPSKIELLMKEGKKQNGDNSSELNDDTSSDAINEGTENKE